MRAPACQLWDGSGGLGAASLKALKSEEAEQGVGTPVLEGAV